MYLSLYIYIIYIIYIYDYYFFQASSSVRNLESTSGIHGLLDADHAAPRIRRFRYEAGFLSLQKEQNMVVVFFVFDVVCLDHF